MFVNLFMAVLSLGVVTTEIHASSCRELTAELLRHERGEIIDPEAAFGKFKNKGFNIEMVGKDSMSHLFWSPLRGKELAVTSWADRVGWYSGPSMQVIIGKLESISYSGSGNNRIIK